MPPLLCTDFDIDSIKVPITFRRAIIFSAIININTALISVASFFFTSVAPSKNPAFILPRESSTLFKTKIETDFIADFEENMRKFHQMAVFRPFKPDY